MFKAFFKPYWVFFSIDCKERYANCNGDELLKACANLLENNQIEEAWQVLHLGKII